MESCSGVLRAGRKAGSLLVKWNVSGLKNLGKRPEGNANRQQEREPRIGI